MNEKYDVFISYRRNGGESTAKILHDKLENLGYRVFFDVESLRSGNFNTALYSVIDECKDFLLVLSPDALERCKNENDWVRLEIEHALEKGLNIIPILLRGFSFPEVLPPSIDEVRYKSGIAPSYDFFDAFIDKLQKFLVSSPPIARRKKPKYILIGAVLAAILGVSITICFVHNLYNNNSNSDPSPHNSDPILSIPESNSNDDNSNSEYEYVDIGNNNVSITKYVGSDNVADLEVPDKLDGKSVTIIESNAFENYDNLKTVGFPLCVTEIKENAFCNCPNLTTINVSALCDVSESAFNHCGEVKTNRLTYNVVHDNSDNSTSLKKYVGGGYITDAEVPEKLNGKFVTIIESNAFENDDGFKTIVFPDSVKEIKENAFCNCPNLTTITVSSLCVVSESAFNNCGEVVILRTYTCENIANSDNSTSITKWVIGYGVDVKIPEEVSGKTVTIIESNAFENGEKLETVVFPDSVKEIKENAFCNCPNLTTITVSKDCKVSENAFNNCGNVSIERRN